MGVYKTAIITTAGQSLIAQALAGNSAVKFTSLKTSNYSYAVSTNFETLTSLQGIKQSAGITSATVVNQTTVKISARVSNIGITTAYYINTIGIYAETDGITETLIAVIPASTADLVPIYSTGAPYSFIYDINLTIQNSSSLNVTINDSGVATVADLQHFYEKTYDVYVTDTASGEVASFEDGANEIPMESVNVNLSPSQSFNGYDRPWAPGAGKNKLNNVRNTSENIGSVTFVKKADGTVVANGTASSNAWYKFNTDKISFSEAVILSGSTGGSSTTYEMQATTGSTQYHQYSSEVTIPANTAVDIYIGIRIGYTASNLTFNPMIRLATETDATYAPYSNICPISGVNEVKVTRTGKNVLENNATKAANSPGLTITRNSDGSLTLNGTLTANKIPVINFATDIDNVSNQNDQKKHIPNGTWTVSLGNDNSNIRVQIYGSNSAGTASLQSIFSAHSGTVTIDDTYAYNWVRLYVTAGTFEDEVIYPMIRPASVTDDTYEPYTGQIFTSPLPSTVYGGSVDAVSGVVTVTDAQIASYNGETLPGAWISDRDVYSAGATPTTGAQVVYKLATPQTAQLEPLQIDSLYGYNNVWSDVRNVDVKYRADTTLYIDKKIAEMQALVLENS